VGLLSFDVSEGKDVFWLDMEHLDGSSLDVIMHGGDLSFDEDGMEHLARQILSALITLHESNPS
jgi:serine/threonine protein kinase